MFQNVEYYIRKSRIYLKFDGSLVQSENPGINATEQTIDMEIQDLLAALKPLRDWSVVKVRTFADSDDVTLTFRPHAGVTFLATVKTTKAEIADFVKELSEIPEDRNDTALVPGHTYTYHNHSTVYHFTEYGNPADLYSGMMDKVYVRTKSNKVYQLMGDIVTIIPENQYTCLLRQDNILVLKGDIAQERDENLDIGGMANDELNATIEKLKSSLAKVVELPNETPFFYYTLTNMFKFYLNADRVDRRGIVTVLNNALSNGRGFVPEHAYAALKLLTHDETQVLSLLKMVEDYDTSVTVRDAGDELEILVNGSPIDAVISNYEAPELELVPAKVMQKYKETYNITDEDLWKNEVIRLQQQYNCTTTYELAYNIKHDYFPEEDFK